MTDVNLIKVLLIDDDPLVLEGWEKAIQRARDIQVVGKVSLAGLRQLSAFPGSPEIVIVKAPLFLKKENGKLIRSLKASGELIKIIAVANSEDEIQKLQKAGADEAILAGFHNQEFVDLIRGLSRDPKGLCSFFADQLASLQPGDNNLTAYETLVSSILQFLFMPPLGYPQLQSYDTSDRHKSALLFPNITDRGFWGLVHSRHEADYILFLLHNAPEVESDHITELEKHLDKPLGFFGVLLTRNAARQPLRLLQLSFYQNQKKVVLVLWDEHIHDMLAFKAAGMDPTELLGNIYEEFFSMVSNMP
jgi:DNA-binding NarL/FixJ family response regulator